MVEGSNKEKNEATKKESNDATNEERTRQGKQRMKVGGKRQ